jgi:hypothetical protein
LLSNHSLFGKWFIGYLKAPATLKNNRAASLVPHFSLLRYIG